MATHVRGTGDRVPVLIEVDADDYTDPGISPDDGPTLIAIGGAPCGRRRRPARRAASRRRQLFAQRSGGPRGGRGERTWRGGEGRRPVAFSRSTVPDRQRRFDADRAFRPRSDGRDGGYPLESS